MTQPTMPAPEEAGTAAAGDGRIASWRSPLVRLRQSRRASIFVLVGVVAYLAWLIVLIPARTVIAESDDLRVGGTIWKGDAVYASMLRIEWSWSPVSSLANLAYTADWRISGDGTDLTGRVSKTGGVYRFSQVRGQADGSLLDLLARPLPMQCRLVADVALDEVVLGGEGQMARGRIHTSPASCVARGMAARVLNLPAMRAEFIPGRRESRGVLATSNGREPVLVVQLPRTGPLAARPTPHAIYLAPPLAGWRYVRSFD